MSARVDRFEAVDAEGHRFRIVTDPTYGYKRLDPIPRQEDLARFYQSQYYHLIRHGGERAHGLKRLMGSPDVAEPEREWLKATLYSDIAHVLRTHAQGKHVLDIGCGRGDVVAYLASEGFAAMGIEPSAEAAEAARARGLTVHTLTLEEFVASDLCRQGERFDAVTLLSVLEHVPDPVDTISAAKQLLRPGGILCVLVPNDFNELQLAAFDRLGKAPWWLVVPDHINYFDFDSLHGFLKKLGLDVIHSQGDFPMEMFLLMGDDYVGDDAVGSACHGRRVRFELGIPSGLRRRLYQAMGAVGVSRTCLMFGKLRG
jgi:2-polyprenyl-3-methyl-5-hydroxy-6-metoxy-1,4-benzoquinol methylase